ncbi:MAG: DUF4388 domain-containing protein [Polyangiaceae bacterium]|jgi:hypothetical protein|nr:DUF4388 domain-containing protein [Polyangiaceae bacterium]
MRQILLIEPDVDLLGQLAERLRARGLGVALANDLPSALLRVRSHVPHILFIASSLAKQADFVDRLLAEPGLIGVPRILLVPPGQLRQDQADTTSYEDIDRLVARALEVTPMSVPPESGQGEIRGDVQQIALVDLLQLLAMNRRTGVLTISTPRGAGELRIADGEVLDSVFRRLEGEKAFYRLLGEREGSFVFSPGGPPAMARLSCGTSTLLMEGMRQTDEVARLRDELGARATSYIAASDCPEDEPRLVEDVLDALARPRTADELLDELPQLDLDILTTLRSLVERNLVRRVERHSAQVPLAAPDQLPLLRALAAKLVRAGYRGPLRLLVAAPLSRLRVLGHTVLRLVGAAASADPPPTAPVPHELAQIRLGEGQELVLVGLPLVDSFSPLWNLCIPGAALVLSLEEAISPALAAVCESLEFRVLKATELLPGFDELEAGQVAQLLRQAIEQAAA